MKTYELVQTIYFLIDQHTYKLFIHCNINKDLAPINLFHRTWNFSELLLSH